MQRPRVDESARSPFTGFPLAAPRAVVVVSDDCDGLFLWVWRGLTTVTGSSGLDLGLGLGLERGGRPATRAGNATHEGVEMRMARGILSRSRSIGTQGHPAA